MSDNGSWAVTRRAALTALLSVPLAMRVWPAVAGGANDVNQIIKGLAPIQGQTDAGGYTPERREEIIIDDTTIYVDAARNVDLEVYFDYNSDVITRKARSQLSALGEALSSPTLSSFRYLIAGHTDARGSDAYNLDLSTRRARSVYRHLTDTYAIDPSRLMVVGFGFRRLKRPNAPQAAINRRVEVLLIVP